MLRMLVVDDHGPFRWIARMLFDGDGFDVVGESADGRSAIADVERLRPDVMLLDVQLPDLSGFDVVAQEVTDRWGPEGPTIVLMSTREGSDYGRRDALESANDELRADLASWLGERALLSAAVTVRRRVSYGGR